MTPGTILKRLREEREMNQDALAKYLGVSRATVSLYEHDERFPSQESLLKYADLFDVSVDYLLGRDSGIFV